MKANLKNDIIVWGAGIEIQDKYNPQTSAGKSAAKIFAEKEKTFSKELREYAREFSLPRQQVEVIEIFDQAQHAHEFATPTPSEIVARVRGNNFDGKAVETVIRLSDLENVPNDPNSVMKLVSAAIEWHDLQKLFGLD